jgi:hypothetical protein
MEIYEDAKERFSDRETGYTVAVKQVKVYGHQREVMIAYKEQGKTVVIVTVYPIKKSRKENRIIVSCINHYNSLSPGGRELE